MFSKFVDPGVEVDVEKLKGGVREYRLHWT